jgi:hypothetical protein
MGSFCKSGPSTSTTTTDSKQKYKPFAQDQMQDIWSQIWKAGQTPYTPYGGQMVAGLNPTQLGGIDKITNATKYLNTAAGYAQQGGADIAPGDISRYYNPFTQGVIDATQRDFAEGNRAQQSQVTGNAALKGALGGDRVGVAQAETARLQKLAQDPVIAKLHQDKYNMAMSAAQADRAAKMQAASGFGALHSGALAGGQSQIGAGSLEQGTEQAKLNALYKQFMEKQQYPFQIGQYLASTGLPVLSAQGGVQSGTGTSTQVQQAAQPSGLQTAVGLGTTALGFMSGNPMMAMGGMGSMFGGGSGGAGMGPIGTYSGGGNPWQSSGAGMNWYARGGSVRGRRNGGFIDRVSELRQAMRRGGGIHVPRGYADGGEVPFMDRFAPAIEAIQSGEFDPQGSNYPESMAMAPEMPAAPPLALPPQIANPGGGGPIMAPPAMQPTMQPAMQPPMVAEAPQERATDFSSQSYPRPQPTAGGGLSEEARMALITAGLGILSSKAGNAMQAIGEGGLVGIKQYTTGKQTKEKNELAARKLLMDAQQFAQGHDLRERTLKETERAHRALEGHRSDSKDLGKYQHIGNTPEGEAVLLDQKTGETVLKPIKVQPKTGAGSKGGVSEWRYNAWLAANPGDEKGALDYAGGRKQMSPVEINKSAHAIVDREIKGMMVPPSDPKAYKAQRLPEVIASLKDVAPGSPSAPGKSGALKPLPPEGLAKAREAIKAGKDPKAVREYLRQKGYDPSALD